MSKRSNGKLKFFQERWFFMISSRPLNFKDYLGDVRVMDEHQIPPLLEFDTIYMYIMGKKGDQSGCIEEIKTIDILNVSVKDMTKSKNEKGHALIVDTGSSLYHLNTMHRFELDKWVEAIFCSMQTSRECRLSITGKCRNISKLIRDFDQNDERGKLRVKTFLRNCLPYHYKYEDVDQLIEAANIFKEELISIVDACMA